MIGDQIDVEMFEMEKAECPDILASGGLGPCIAIGVYDLQSKSGYMMHDPQFEEEDLEERIKIIREDYKDLSRLSLFVAGNAFSAGLELGKAGFKGIPRERIYASRELVINFLKKYFKDSQMKVQWLPDNYTGELYLDTSTGKFTFESSPEYH